MWVLAADVIVPTPLHLCKQFAILDEQFLGDEAMGFAKNPLPLCSMAPIRSAI
jgi:hypothetical protein